MRQTNHARAYEFLRDSVLVDPRNQGTFINEQEVAEELGCSRTPVREALRVLSSEGLVEFIPNRGTYIPVISDKQIADLMELRKILECHAAGKAIRNDQRPSLKMGEILEKQEKLLQEPDASFIEFIALDREFHFVLLSAAENSEILNTADRIQVRQRIVGTEALFRRQRWEDVCAEHQAIVDGLNAKDMVRVNEAISAHLDKTQEVLIRHRSLGG